MKNENSIASKQKIFSKMGEKTALLQAIIMLVILVTLSMIKKMKHTQINISWPGWYQ